MPVPLGAVTFSFQQDYIRKTKQIMLTPKNQVSQAERHSQVRSDRVDGQWKSQLQLSRGRLKSSRAARSSREGSGYISSAQDISREASGQLRPRDGIDEPGPGGVRVGPIRRGLWLISPRWLGPLRMTLGPYRYETSHVARHCKGGSVVFGSVCRVCYRLCVL